MVSLTALLMIDFGNGPTNKLSRCHVRFIKTLNQSFTSVIGGNLTL